ncbi:hypothetical protein M9978_16465 [Sphingomonas sp. MG17]|uniref:Uncharacterized protein n=1 Tax=Sphingomonas tagetis TaxID=2949092 RepID=A0A9X2HSW4_9SPHN|nr:hypothetical protein [Sphingomonas tagetis]MCP3732020.1 hypothetical protein [Sphingomonas tagetis]
MSMPRLLRGADAIGEYLGISAAQVMHKHKQGQLPTFRVGGCPYATTGALDDWRTLYRAGKLPG